MTEHISFSKLLPKTFYLSLVLVCTVFLAHAQDAKTAAATYNEGLELLKAKDYEAGLPLLEDALKLAEAEENTKVIELSKKNGAIAAYNVGNTKAKAGELDAAMGLYKRGIELRPEYGSNYSGLGRVLSKSGKKSEAVDSYLKALDIATTNKKAKKISSAKKKLNVIVGKEYTSKNYDSTIELGKKVLAATEIGSVHYYVARALLEKGENEAAVDHATKAIEKATADDKMEDKYYIAQAKAFAAVGKKEEAIEAFGKVTNEKYLESAQYQISQLKG